MRTSKEIQEAILKETGIKTSVKKGTGSMKGYLIFSSMFQDGTYPEFPFEWRQEFKTRFPQIGDKFPAASGTQIYLYGIDQDSIKFKNGRKPKPIDPNKSVKSWGSKNSQIRLDKASRRNAVKMNKGNTARYY